MASWQQLKQYIYEKYTVSQDIEVGVKLEFSGDNGRTQMVFVTHQQLMDGTEDWVTIESPVGRIAEVDLPRAIHEAGHLVCGGLGAAFGDPEILVLRHAVPLENLDVNEFERPFHLLMGTADTFELNLTGGRDQY
ncbi:MAG TPA: hypothetical protein VG816_09505 [Solirubrobacterales bacterium]|nr:hypothetical protein [Solirubrobacterales bacterium]